VLALMAEGLTNTAIAAALDRDHRRVLAVLRYLGADGP
jgi:DNA-binding NarL/FixJ family response regulator